MKSLIFLPLEIKKEAEQQMIILPKNLKRRDGQMLWWKNDQGICQGL